MQAFSAEATEEKAASHVISPWLKVLRTSSWREKVHLLGYQLISTCVGRGRGNCQTAGDIGF